MARHPMPIALSALVLATAVHATPADTLAARSHWLSTVRFAAGTVAIDLAGVSPLIARQGFSGADRRVQTLGPEITWQRGALSIGLTGQQFLGRAERRGDLELRTSGGYGMVDPGLGVTPVSWLTIRPVLGVGASAIRLELSSSDVIAVDSLILAPRTETVVTGRSYLRHAGVSVVAKLPVMRRQRTMSVQVDAGVVSPLTSTRWRRTWVDAGGTPRASLEGWYLRAGAGFSGASAGEALVPMLLMLVPFVH